MSPRTVEVISFPKSGKTWLRFLVAAVLAERMGEPAERVQRAMMPTGEDVSWWPAGLTLPVFSHGEHRPGGPFPVERYRGRAIVRLVRDPRDVVASHYLHERFGMRRFEGTIEAFVTRRPGIEDLNTNRDLWGAWAIIDFMNQWHRHRALFAADTLVRYERLRAQPHEGLALVLEALGVQADRAAIGRAVEACDIERMRAMESTGRYRHLGLQGAEAPEGRKVRRGQVGGHREVLTPALCALIDDLIARELDPAFACYGAGAAQAAG